jgi:cytochrome c biogenesis protein CcmG/thiol:disulfide interchange protein DsbE
MERRRIVELAVAASIWTTLGCAPKGGQTGAAALPPSDHPLAGSPAPAFELSSPASGASAGLAQYAGRVVLVDFWATWCEPCRESFPRYQALLQRYGDKVAVIGISEDDDHIGIDSFGQETGVSFPLVWDDEKSVAQEYQIKGMPTLFIIDKNGLVRFVHSGFYKGDEARITAAVDSLL